MNMMLMTLTYNLYYGIKLQEIFDIIYSKI